MVVESEHVVQYDVGFGFDSLRLSATDFGCRRIHRSGPCSGIVALFVRAEPRKRNSCRETIMNYRNMWSGMVLLGALVVVSGFAIAQQSDGKKDGKTPSGMPDMSNMSAEDLAKMQKHMATMMPGENHSHLDYFVGTWDTTSRVWMGGPGTEPMTSKGKSSVKWVLGGRYIMDEYEGEMMGMPYEGIGFTGYDNYKNLYVSTWASNMDTQLLVMTGSRDPSGKVYTYYGSMDEPSLDVHGRTVKYVTRILSDDKYVFSIYDLHARDDYKVIEISYVRQK
jgi:Protein of unknown function (DUF1579)